MRKMVRLKVKEVAQSKGFSMGELSRKSNVAYNTIKLIYREPFREVTTTTLNKIAKALAVPVTDLLEDVPEEDIK
jgi:DNA-binding Xre family transcriptional regulator